jgi:hypothetical protein
VFVVKLQTRIANSGDLEAALRPRDQSGVVVLFLPLRSFILASDHNVSKAMKAYEIKHINFVQFKKNQFNSLDLGPIFSINVGMRQESSFLS